MQKTTSTEVLIIVDMLKGFCNPGYPLSLSVPSDAIAQNILEKARSVMAVQGHVLFLCDNHKTTDPEINNPYPPHCMQGSEEAEIIDALQSIVPKAKTINKSTLSIFYRTGLEDVLRKINPTKISVTGVCTDICILFAAYELRIRGYQVFVAENTVLPLDAENQHFFLRYLEQKLGVQVA